MLSIDVSVHHTASDANNPPLAFLTQLVFARIRYKSFVPVIYSCGLSSTTANIGTTIKLLFQSVGSIVELCVCDSSNYNKSRSQCQGSRSSLSKRIPCPLTNNLLKKHRKFFDTASSWTLPPLFCLREAHTTLKGRSMKYIYLFSLLFLTLTVDYFSTIISDVILAYI